MDDSIQNFMNNTRQLLDERGMSQAELAEASGLTAGAISNLLAGTRQIKRLQLDTVTKIATALGVTIDDLISEHECRHFRLQRTGPNKAVCQRCGTTFRIQEGADV
jgi:transcriptional regulator with XRE-family HTH domain